MALIHGRSISGEEIERIVSREFDARRFASLCNAIAWALARVRCSSLPSFTERVNVKDKGVDAEWSTDLPGDANDAAALLGPGWNVHQYKQRDLFARGREEVLSGIKSGLKGAVKDLYDATNRRPDRYVVFTNADLSHDQKTVLKTIVQQ